MLEFVFLTVALACSGPILDYDIEFDRLSKIIVADGSTDDQRKAARKAIKVLTHQMMRDRQLGESTNEA